MRVRYKLMSSGVWCRGITLPSHGRGPGFKSPLIQFFVFKQCGHFFLNCKSIFSIHYFNLIINNFKLTDKILIHKMDKLNLSEGERDVT